MHREEFQRSQLFGLDYEPTASPSLENSEKKNNVYKMIAQIKFITILKCHPFVISKEKKVNTAQHLISV